LRLIFPGRVFLQITRLYCVTRNDKSRFPFSTICLTYRRKNNFTEL